MEVHGGLERRTLAVLRRGIEAALAASVPQVLVAKAEEKLFLPAHETADIGPRFIEELAHRLEQELPEDSKWLAASAFHFGYATFWGSLYALLYERRPVRPFLGGLALGGFIWLITFPPWGGAVLSGSERPPGQRSLRMEIVMGSAAFTFGLGTALLYGRGPDASRRAAR